MRRVPKTTPLGSPPAQDPAFFSRLAERLQEELNDLEARLEEERERLSALSPLPVHWKPVRCGKEDCRRCPHGPYPYLREKREGKWRWKYLGKGWQPPEGFVRPQEFLEGLVRYKRLLRRREELLSRLEEAQAALAGRGGGRARR